MFKLIFDFNYRVVKVCPPVFPTVFSPEEKDWMVKVLREEASELEEAVDISDQVDALIDSMIFAVGGLCRLGLTYTQAAECFEAVMEANYLKKNGQKPGREAEGVADAIKPEGWKDPKEKIREILNHG